MGQVGTGGYPSPIGSSWTDSGLSAVKCYPQLPFLGLLRGPFADSLCSWLGLFRPQCSGLHMTLAQVPAAAIFAAVSPHHTPQSQYCWTACPRQLLGGSGDEAPRIGLAPF